MHMGIALRLEYVDGRGRRFVFTGDRKQVPTGPLSIVTGRFRSVDELDGVMFRIAGVIADRWQAATREGNEVAWASGPHLTPNL